MSQPAFYMLLGLGLWVLGLFALWQAREAVRRIIALNVMSSGVFLVMVALAARNEPRDAVLHALVVTGLVVAICATAFALRLALASPKPGAGGSARRKRP